MSFFQIGSIFITLAAVFSYINYRFIRLPTSIGVMLISIVVSMALICTEFFGINLHAPAAALVEQIDFNKVLLHALLAFLLFAGALQLDLSDLAKQWLPISVLASVGTIVSTFIIAGTIWLVAHFLNLALPWIECLLFGADLTDRSDFRAGAAEISQGRDEPAIADGG